MQGAGGGGAGGQGGNGKGQGKGQGAPATPAVPAAGGSGVCLTPVCKSVTFAPM